MPVLKIRSGFGLGLAQTGDAVAVLALPAFLKQLGALKPFQNVSFATQGGCCPQTGMLRHKLVLFLFG